MISPSPPDRIAQLELELRAAIQERDMYKILAEQRVSQDAIQIENARDWREFNRLILKASRSNESRGK